MQVGYEPFVTLTRQTAFYLALSFRPSTRRPFLQKLALFTPTHHPQMSSSSSVSKPQSVSNVQNRKRPNSYDTTQDSPPAKRVKSTSAVRIASNFPPQFWDNLSKVWLTPRALREIDRRNGARPPVTTSPAPTVFTATTLTQFARRGGPDLRHLRGYPVPKHTALRQDLRKTVIPTSHRRASIAPNFFVEAKAPHGGADVAKRQACLDGARAMHSIQNHGEDKLVYDGNGYTYSSTYHNGQLLLYAHHLTAPTADGERPEYHMTQIDT
ncbi:hypothetical protein NOR_08451 [Metarhizium rileyi]|uniref:Uncharacterized protein n=1 Tax=Metarhizium rileyi (strain RCEF 4871) TaxID=1649241 RepID=A0A166WA20_METRR|nr:hypothetical protein NOR_08451 [Metarhizium rileyi RCEF 4871]